MEQVPYPRQLEILVMHSRGMTRKEIAGELFLSPLTVRNHLLQLCHRIGARDRCHALSICIARGYLAVDGREHVIYVPEPVEDPVAA